MLLFAACIAACNALSGVEDLTPCSECELDGALPVVDAANDVDTLPGRDSSTGTTDAAQDVQVPADATTLDADAEAAAPIGCQGAVDCTRVVFVTSGHYTGDLGGIAGADAKCQALADLSPVARIKGHTFQAWISITTSLVSARLTHGSQPYVLGNGTVVANDWTDLIKGTLANGIDLDEQNNVGSGGAWTGTTSAGAQYAGAACTTWTTGTTGSGVFGNVGGSGNGWSSSANNPCPSMNALYCFEK
jgi:hypothetical protein